MSAFGQEVGNMLVTRNGEQWTVRADLWPKGWGWNAYHGCGVFCSRRDDYPTPKAAMLAGAKYLHETATPVPSDEAGAGRET